MAFPSSSVQGLRRPRRNSKILLASSQRPGWIGTSAPRLNDYAVRNPVASLSAATLTVGGLLLMGFFLRIGFMPDLDLAGSMALLFAAAVVGLGTLFMLVLATVMPGVATRYLLDEIKRPVTRRALLAVAGPAAGFVAITVLRPLSAPSSPKLLGNWLPWVAFAAVAVIASAALVGAFGRQPWRDAPRKCLHEIATLTGASLVWVLGLLMVVQAALPVAVDSVHVVWITVLVLVGWLFFIICINAAMATVPLRHSIFVGPLAGILSLLLLATLTSSFSTLSAATVRALGIGDLRGVSVVVSPETCQALRTMAGAIQCEPLEDKAQVGLLKNVTILSRVGAHVVMEKAPAAASTPAPRRVVLRKDAVVLWTPGSPTR